MPLHNRGETTGGGKIDVHSYVPALFSLSLKQLSAWNNGLETNKRGSASQKQGGTKRIGTDTPVSSSLKEKY